MARPPAPEDDRRQAAPADGEGDGPAPAGKPDRRRSVVDTRTPEERVATGLERRRGPGRRRTDFARAAEEGEMTAEQFLFVKAVDAYKRVNQKPFPTWTEVLEIVRKLGYRKTQPMTLDIPSVEDWQEPADAPAFPPPAFDPDDEQDDRRDAA